MVDSCSGPSAAARHEAKGLVLHHPLHGSFECGAQGLEEPLHGHRRGRGTGMMLLFHFPLSLPCSASTGPAELAGNAVSQHTGKGSWVTDFSLSQETP